MPVTALIPAPGSQPPAVGAQSVKGLAPVPALPPLRIAILWRSISDTFNACFRQLQDAGHEGLVCFPDNDEDAPYPSSDFEWMKVPIRYPGLERKKARRLTHYLSDGGLDADRLLARLQAFDPQVILVNSWHVPAYRKALKAFPSAARIIRTDNQWHRSPRLLLASLIGRRYVGGICDAMFVPGERQYQFARNIGIPEGKIWLGSNAANHAAMATVHHNVIAGRRTYGRRFVFAGRLIPAKGVDTLAEAYRLYRERVGDPWPLAVCGNGPLSGLLEDLPGVELLGFVDPNRLPEIFSGASCLVMPCRREPWGNALVNAAAAGLALIATPKVGASIHVLHDRYNGFLVPMEDAESLASAMVEYAQSSDAARAEMSRRSYALALPYKPDCWVQAFTARARAILAAKT